MGSIMSMLSGAFSAIGKIFGFLGDKNKENLIRKGYEEEKRADALEEDKTAKEQIEKAEKKKEEAKAATDAVSNADLKDAEKTEEEIEEELESIEEESEQEKREREIKAAKELKKRKAMRKQTIENDDSFNKGDTISFGG